MDTEKIKILLDAVALGSFSKSAEKSSYTPSAISHIADSVEAELGVKILQRDYKGIKLNDNGQAILPYLQAIISAEQDIFSVAQNLSGNKQQLIIGCYASVAKNYLPEVIKGFKKDNPSSNISVAVCDSFNEMAEKNADIYFISESENLTTKNRVWKKVIIDEYFAVLPKGTTTAKAVSNQFFTSHPFIMHNSLDIARYFEGVNLDVVSINSTDDASVISMVKNGLGFSILPKLSLIGVKREVQILPLLNPISRTIGVSYPISSKNSLVNKFIKWLNK